MPALKNTRHEAFAQARFKGQTADQAYQSAGYKANDSNAARLKGNERIVARMPELQAQACKKTVPYISFSAVDMFQRLINTCTAAEAAGDHKAAIDGQKFVLRCFGYEDSPTLTHEHITGQKLPEKADEGGDHEQQDPTATMAQAMTSAFPEALKKLKNRSMN